MSAPTTLSDAVRLPAFAGRWRLPAVLLGCVIAGCGIALTLRAQLGVGPFDVLNDGLAAQLGLTFGTASILASSALVLLGWRLGARVGAGTLVAMLLVGPSVDAWMWVMPALPEALAGRVGALGLGVLVLSYGFSMVIASGLGSGPMEVLMLGLAHRGAPLRWVRTGQEAVLCAAGAALGGQVGGGTVVIALVIGHLLAAFVPSEVASG